MFSYVSECTHPERGGGELVEGQEDKLSINEKGNETIDGPAGSEKVSASGTEFAQETGLVSIRNVRKPDS